MFGWFRADPVQRLNAEYLRLLEQARDRQRNGDLVGFAQLTDRAQRIAAQIEAIQRSR